MNPDQTPGRTRGLARLRFGAMALLLACAPEVAEPPHVSLQQLRRAVEEGDTTVALQYIDPDAIAARLVSDGVEAVRDSFKAPPTDSLGRAFRAAIDSVKRELVALLKSELGFTASPSSEADSARRMSEDVDDIESDLYPSEEILSPAVEIVGDGRARYVGDTALVDRVIRYRYHDTTATLRLALVPVGRSHWRIVAFHNAVALGKALRNRQAAVLERANKQLRDSIRARVSTRDVLVSREPLTEWGRYAVEVRATVQNHSRVPVLLYAMQMTGPHLSLEDTVAQLLEAPRTVRAGGAISIVWRHDLRVDDAGLFDLIGRPKLYSVEITDAEWGGRPPSRVQLYRSWHEYIRRNPLPAPTLSGVLAQLR